MPSTKKLRKRRIKRYEKLRKAVNAYLMAQNSNGYQDGREGCEDHCVQARSELCEAVYALNMEAGDVGGGFVQDPPPQGGRWIDSPTEMT
jgi:hypothetical protein